MAVHGFWGIKKLFIDPAVRRQMVPVIHAARQKDAQAADHLEQALANWH